MHPGDASQRRPRSGYSPGGKSRNPPGLHAIVDPQLMFRCDRRSAIKKLQEWSGRPGAQGGGPRGWASWGWGVAPRIRAAIEISQGKGAQGALGDPGATGGGPGSPLALGGTSAFSSQGPRNACPSLG